MKQDGGSVKVWRCIVADGTGDSIIIDSKIDQKLYLYILKGSWSKDAEKLAILNRFHFYQDNDSKHEARTVQERLLYNCPKVMETPPQFPDNYLI